MPTKTPRVSVIMPAYNVEKYIAEAIESVLNQTFTDFELIIINDGSTDSTSKIIEKYAKSDKRIKVINQKNSGVSVARNVGLDIARGEYIGFIDSDDYISLDYYEKLYNRAQETHSDVVVCERIMRFAKKKKKLWYKVSKNLVTTDTREKFAGLYLPEYCYPVNKIYKRSCLKERFIEDIPCYEDICFICNALVQCRKLSVAEGTIYYYRDRPNSAVNTHSIQQNYLYHAANAYFYDFLLKHKIDLNVDEYKKTKKYKLFGLTIFKVLQDSFTIKYYLFNFKIFQSYIK